MDSGLPSRAFLRHASFRDTAAGIVAWRDQPLRVVARNCRPGRPCALPMDYPRLPGVQPARQDSPVSRHHPGPALCRHGVVRGTVLHRALAACWPSPPAPGSLAPRRIRTRTSPTVPAGRHRPRPLPLRLLRPPADRRPVAVSRARAECRALRRPRVPGTAVVWHADSSTSSTTAC